jgi:hypothetical protein
LHNKIKYQAYSATEKAFIKRIFLNELFPFLFFFFLIISAIFYYFNAKTEIVEGQAYYYTSIVPDTNWKGQVYKKDNLFLDTANPSSIAFHYTIVFGIIGMFTFGFIFIYLRTTLAKQRDYFGNTKVVELATITDIITTPANYIIVTNSLAQTSVELAENETQMPKIGNAIILVYHPNTCIFIGYYWE